MSFAKLAKIDNSWKWIVFSDEEEKAIREKHRVSCNKIFAECMDDAKGFVDTSNTLLLTEVAIALFSKRGDAIYSALQKEIDQAIFDLIHKK